MEKLSIRIISNGIFPEKLDDSLGGALRVEVELARELYKNSYRVQVIGQSKNCYSEECGNFGTLYRIKPQRRLKVGSKDFSYLFPLLLWTMRNKRCDILHANTNPYLLYLPKAKKKILHLHSSIAGIINNSYLRAIKRADAVICVSKFNKKELITLTDYPAEKIYVAYNGVDIEKFDSASGDEIRHRFNFGDEFIILYCGQIGEIKGLVYLIKAFKRISQQYSRAKLVVAGSSQLWDWRSEADRVYEKRIQRMSRDLDIHFLGKVTYEVIPFIYKACDVFVLPSIQEGLPLSILEAMASGKPVIATRVGGISEVIEDGVNGFLVPPKSVEDLADSITKLIEDKDLKAKMGREGKKIVQNYSWKKTADSVMRVYEAVTGKCL